MMKRLQQCHFTYHPGRLMGLGLAALLSMQAPATLPALQSNTWTSQPASVTSIHRPLSFEANLGQADEQVKFISRSGGGTLFLTATEAVLALRNDERRMMNAELKNPDSAFSAHRSSFRSLRMKLVGGNPHAAISGLEDQSAKVNYYIGNDPTRWFTDVPTYARVKYESVYPGIDLVYYGNQRQLEYDFIVAPGADPNIISLGFEGADQIEVDARGDLALHTSCGLIRHRKPVVYQEVNGVRQEIASRYVLSEPITHHPSPITHHVSFNVGPHNSTIPLVIDPVMCYSACIGGSGEDQALGVAVDAFGFSYVTGATDSKDFPITQGQIAGFQCDGFVLRLDPTGKVVYSTVFGGSGEDRFNAIAVDARGNAYVAGETDSKDIPITRGEIAGIQCNGVHTAFDPTGRLIYSTVIGGSGEDRVLGVATDEQGFAYVAGSTNSPDFPMMQGPIIGLTCSPGLPDGAARNGFVLQLNPTGTPTFSTLIGGSGEDIATSIAFRGNSVYVAGITDTSIIDTSITDTSFVARIAGFVNVAGFTSQGGPCASTDDGATWMQTSVLPASPSKATPAPGLRLIRR
jgi:hypothetical protein